MSVSPALRSATLSAYRRLLRASHSAARDCAISDVPALSRYVSARFAAAAAAATAASQHSRRRQRQRRSHSDQMNHSDHLGLSGLTGLSGHSGLSFAREMALRLEGAADSPALASMLRALSANVGSAAYRRALERGFLRHKDFAQRDAARRAHDAGATAERQNRVMQHALMPYGERLLLLHRVGPGGLAPRRAEEAIIGARSSVSAHYVAHGAEHAMVEVDEGHNRQVVYVRCAAHDWARREERVAAAEPEEMRGTILHAEFSATAARLCDALVAEAPLHAYRATVVVGYGDGGAVGLCLALLLHTRGFEVTNCVTFGAPKAIVTTLHRYVHAITPVRVVLEGDPLVELPVTDAEGDVFVHHGEVLCMAAAGGSKADSRAAAHMEKEAEEEEKEEEESEGMSADALADILAVDSAAAGIDEPLVEHDEAEDNEDDNIHSYKRHTDVDGMVEKPLEDRKSRDAKHNRDDADENDDDDDDEDEEWEMTARCRLAAQRYEAGYTLDHYVTSLLDPTTPLTYAEGDDVWDEGDYARTRNESPMPRGNHSDAVPPL